MEEKLSKELEDLKKGINQEMKASVPDSYFTQLQDQVWNKLGTSETDDRKGGNSAQNTVLKIILLVVAGAILALTLFWLFSQNESSPEPVALEQTPDAELIEYLSSHLSEDQLSTVMITERVTEEEQWILESLDPTDIYDIVN